MFSRSSAVTSSTMVSCAEPQNGREGESKLELNTRAHIEIDILVRFSDGAIACILQYVVSCLLFLPMWRCPKIFISRRSCLVGDWCKVVAVVAAWVATSNAGIVCCCVAIVMIYCCLMCWTRVLPIAWQARFDGVPWWRFNDQITTCKRRSIVERHLMNRRFSWPITILCSPDFVCSSVQPSGSSSNEGFQSRQSRRRWCSAQDDYGYISFGSVSNAIPYANVKKNRKKQCIEL